MGALCMIIRDEYFAYKRGESFLPRRDEENGETYYTFDNIKDWRYFTKNEIKEGKDKHWLYGWNLKDFLEFLDVLELYMRINISKEKNDIVEVNRLKHNSLFKKIPKESFDDNL
jgi:hypothetical protein